jgi:hypothetical protein
MAKTAWDILKKQIQSGEYNDYEREQARSLSVVDKDEETKRRYREYVAQVMESEKQAEIAQRQMQAAEQANRPNAPVQITAGAANLAASPQVQARQIRNDYDNWENAMEKAEFIARNNPQVADSIKQKTQGMPTFSEMPAEDKYKLYVENVKNEIRDAGKSQEYKNWRAKQDKDPEFRRKSEEEKHRQYMLNLENTAKQEGTLPESQRYELTEYKYGNLNDKERAAINTIMQVEAEDFEEYEKYGRYGGVNAANGGVYAAGDRNKRKLEAINSLKSLGWNDQKIESEVARYQELADFRKTQELNKEVAIDPNAPMFEQKMQATKNLLGSVARNAFAPIESLGAENGAYGRNTSSKYLYSTNRSNEERNQILGFIGDDNPVGQMIASGAMSSADSLVQMLMAQGVTDTFGVLGAGNALKEAKAAGNVVKGMKAAAATEKALEVASLVPFSVGAYNSGYKEGINRGFSEKQAQWYGAAVGGIEAATEIASLDKLWDMASATKVGRNLFMSYAVQAGIEGSEEVASNIGDRFADWLAVKVGKTGKTQKDLDIETYIAEHPGASREEAAAAATQKFIEETIEAGVTGVISALPNTLGSSLAGLARAGRGGDINQAISDRYQSLEVTGDTDYEQMLKADKEKYQNNPTQFIVDNYKAADKEGERIKAGLQEIADKEREGKKLSASDKAFIAENAQIDQAFVDKLYDTGEDSVVPYEFRDVRTDISEDDARRMLAEAAASGDSNKFADVAQAVMNSSDENVSKNADEIISEYAGMAQSHGITQESIGQAVLSQKKAYLAGLKGENIENLSDKNKIAYNEGKKAAIEERARTTIENDAIKNTEVATKSGSTVKLMGAFTDEGIQTSNGNMKVEDLELTGDSAAIKAYQYADRYDNVNVKNAFISNIQDGVNIEQYRAAFDKMYDSAMAGVSFENAKKSVVSKFADEGILEAAYKTGETERSERSYKSLAQALGEAKSGTGEVVNESSSADADMVDFFSKLARATGLTFKIVDELEQKNARGSFKVNESTITVRADRMDAVYHELGEFTETYNKAEYDDLRHAIADFSSYKLGHDKYMRFLKDYQRAYERAGQDSSADEMSGEMFNDTISIMMRSDKGRQALADFLAKNYGAEEAKSIGQKAADLMRKLGDAVKKAFKGEKNGYEGEMEKYADQLGAYAGMFVKALDKAVQNYQKAQTNNVAQTADERFSIKVDANGKNYIDIQDDIISGITDDSEIKDYVRTYMQEYFPALNVMGFDLPVNAKSRNEFTNSEYTKKLQKKLHNLFMDKMRMAGSLDEIVEGANGYKYELPKHSRKDDIIGFVRGNVQIRVGNNDYLADVVFADRKNAGLIFYDIVGIKPTTIKVAAQATSSNNGVRRQATTTNKKISQNAGNSNTKLSLSVDSQGKELTKGQKEFYADESPLLLDENGALKRYYHGTARKDRVGTVFDPARATSGPMPFFTDDQSIAENYSKDKEDTSLSRDERYDSYYTQFRLNINGKDVSIPDAWNMLPYSKKQEIKEKAGHIAFDDDYDGIHYYKNKTDGNGAFTPYELNRHKGNYLETLIDTWLETGDLLDREEDFLDVLKLVGIDNAEYLNPDAKDPGVFETYLHITNPMDTSNIPKKVVTALKKASKSAFFDEMAAVSDMWDKNRMQPEKWIERLEDNIKEDSTTAWTVIPDWVTATLKSLGYDGIVDQGGKYHDHGHQVVIPFESNQIKDINNENPTENSDIRFSIDPDEDRVYYAPRLRGNLEIVKNATNEEYRQMREDILEQMPWLRGTDTPLLRHTYDEEGNTYYWSAADGIHAQVEPLINKHWNTRTSQHWEWWLKDDKDEWPIDYSTRYSIGGIGAFMADMGNLDKAREMEEAGETKDEIFEQTGWYRGADKKWRFEIDDSDAQIKDDFIENYVKNEKYRLNDVLDFDELFKKYPALRNVNVQVIDYPGNAAGSYSSRDNTISLDEINALKGYSFAKSIKDGLMDIMLHEVQHAIQHMEHFAAGSNPGMWTRRERGPVMYTRGDMVKYLDAEKELQKIKEESPKGLVEGMKRSAWLTRTGEVLAARDLWKELKAEYGDQFEKYWDADATVKFFEPSYEELTAMEAYEMTAGEIEAREVEERHTWNKDMRKIIPTTDTAKGVLFAENMDDPWEVPERFSLDVDSDGNRLTKDQQKYFNNTKVVDENGALKVMYHGARGAGFTVFNADYSDDGRSIFFTDDPRVAKSYIGTFEKFKPLKPMTFDELASAMEGYTGGDLYLEEDGDDVVVMEFGTIQDGDKEVYRGNLKGAQEYFIDSIKDVFHNTDANYEVYLNLENPLVIDAKGSNWDEIDWNTEESGRMSELGNRINELNKKENTEGLTQAETQEYDEISEEYNALEDKLNSYGDIGTTRGVAAYAMDHGYDGVIINNVYDIGMYADIEENVSSTIAIAFNPEQIKDIDNPNPTSSEDIRYALDLEDEGGWIDFGAPGATQTTEEDAINVLEKGMEALKNKEVDVPKLRTLALKLRHEYGSTYNTNTLTDNLRKAFAYMQTEDHVDYKTMMGILKDIARPVIEQSGEKIGEQEYKDFLSYFKGKKIKLTSKQKEEVRYAFGSYKNFRNAVMPITFSDNADTTLDQLWDEMVEQSGYMLDRDASEGDMPANLLDVLQAMRPTMRNDFGGDIDDVSKDLAMRIVEEYIEGEAAKEMHKDVQEYRARLKKDYQERRKELTGQINAELRARNKRQAEQAKEREQVRILKGNIRVNANKLMTWVEKPTEGKSVPHNMMVPVVQFLQAIDFVDPVIMQGDDGKWHTRVLDHYDIEDGHAKNFTYKDIEGDTYEEVLQKFNDEIGRGKGTKDQRAWTEKMQGIREIYDKVLKDSDFEDTSMDFLMQTLDAQGLAEDFDDLLAKHKGELNMNHLDSKDLGLIDNIIKNIFHALNKGNKAFSKPSVDIANLAQSTIADAEGKEVKSRGKIRESLYKMLRLDNVTPRTFFKLMGNRGIEVYKFLRSGLNQEILDLKKASEFMEDAMKGIDASKWTGNSATIHEFPLSSGTVRMTDAQIMGLYMTIRRKGGMDRIKGGIKVDEIKTKGLPIKQKVVHLTDSDIQKIESVLTPEQIDLAKKMQQYMANDCSAMGNDTSMKLYGYKKFTDDTYYPWSVDRETIATTNSSENIPMFTGIERSGFTKQLKEGATNPLVIKDIFDVFTDHISQMAAYHGYAASVKDTLRWMNYREQKKKDGFIEWITNKNAINALTGSNQGVGYINKLLLDINKANESQYIGNMTDILMGNYKAAAVGANLRVVAQQPTAYFRALNQIDPKYLFSVNPSTAVKNIKKSQEESPISWWKSKGYYETNLGQPIKEIVTGIASPMEKAKDILMSPAGWADDVTWGFLYTAVEKEQRDLHRGEKITPDEFRKMVNDRFDEVVDNTQVVDSTLHRSQYMRSADRLNKIQTAFMAEPTKSYNMLLEATIEDLNDGTKNRTARAITAFLLAALATSAAAAVVDTMRKAKDDDKWWEVWLNNLKENMADNMNPFNLLPVVKDVSAAIYNQITGASTYGQSGNRFDIEAITSVMNAVNAWKKLIDGENNKTGYGFVMANLKPISQITGVPLYGLTRDIVALYNTFFDNIETTVNSQSAGRNEIKKDFVKDVNRERSDETLEESITDALNHGVSIYDLKGAIQSEYKNKYFDLYSEGKEEDARELADKAARAYARMGLTDEEIDEIINGWQEEAITYTALDKAIASGEGIEDEVKHVQEGKDDDKIIKHIMDRYTQTVAYEDTHDTESAWRSNVETALQTVDPTLTFDSAHEEAIEKKKAADEKAATTAKNTAMKQDFYDAVEKMDGSAGRKALETMKNEGIEAKTVKSAVSTRYHEAWKEAKKQGDTAAMKKAESDWKSAYKLVNNVYNSKSDNLDQTWKKWEKEQE